MENPSLPFSFNFFSLFLKEKNIYVLRIHDIYITYSIRLTLFHVLFLFVQ